MKQRSEFTRHFERHVVRSHESSIASTAAAGSSSSARDAGTTLFIVDSEVGPPDRKATLIR